MNIIIEGCDGTGKTTLAQFLCKQLKMQYCHESFPRTYLEYKQMLEFGGIVFDRFCYGQFVYNKEEERKLTKQELELLATEIFPQTNTLVLYVELSTEAIIDRICSRGEMSLADVDKASRWIKNIRGTYRQILRESKTNYIEIKGDNGLCLNV